MLSLRNVVAFFRIDARIVRKETFRLEFGPAAQRWMVGAVAIDFSGVERVGLREFVSPQH